MHGVYECTIGGLYLPSSELPSSAIPSRSTTISNKSEGVDEQKKICIIRIIGPFLLSAGRSPRVPTTRAAAGPAHQSTLYKESQNPHEQHCIVLTQQADITQPSGIWFQKAGSLIQIYIQSFAGQSRSLNFAGDLLPIINISTQLGFPSQSPERCVDKAQTALRIIG